MLFKWCWKYYNYELQATSIDDKRLAKLRRWKGHVEITNIYSLYAKREASSTQLSRFA